ncbi:MAG: hypothetical protein BWY86_00320 [Candidatus Aminicenantes bacterium ADurb.Bin508]|nr:MAG: hypothetical protein BWY86_00320 [Candidatus Aminicenantes bacterium ADurb.Bin508]
MASGTTAFIGDVLKEGTEGLIAPGSRGLDGEADLLESAEGSLDLRHPVRVVLTLEEDLQVMRGIPEWVLSLRAEPAGDGIHEDPRVPDVSDVLEEAVNDVPVLRREVLEEVSLFPLPFDGLELLAPPLEAVMCEEERAAVPRDGERYPAVSGGDDLHEEFPRHSVPVPVLTDEASESLPVLERALSFSGEPDLGPRGLPAG